MVIYCSTGTFYSLTDYFDHYRTPLDTNYIFFRGVQYILDESLDLGETYNRREIVGGTTYYYHGK